MTSHAIIRHLSASGVVGICGHDCSNSSGLLVKDEMCLTVGSGMNTDRMPATTAAELPDVAAVAWGRSSGN